MARGDRLFCRIETDFLFMDPRFHKLTPNQKWLYLCMWATAVEHRTEVLPQYIDIRAVSYRSQLDGRTVRRGLQKCTDLGLLHWEEGSRIHVPGARKKHSRLREWYGEVSPYGEFKGHEIGSDCQERERESREREREREEEKKTPPAPSTSGTNGKLKPEDEQALKAVLQNSKILISEKFGHGFHQRGDSVRMKKLRSRFRDGFKPEELLGAVQIMCSDDWEERGSYCEPGQYVWASKKKLIGWLERSQKAKKKEPGWAPGGTGK